MFYTSDKLVGQNAQTNCKSSIKLDSHKRELKLKKVYINVFLILCLQSSLQYVRNHDHVILDPAHSPSELSEIFLPGDLHTTAGVKRRASER